jgi:hypothetical protein
MMTTYDKLLTADVVCNDCGKKYGKYSVGCSSVWEGTCDVCGETKGVTEVRDWGYLTKGIHELKPSPLTPELKAKIKEQSKEVADYMLTVGPIMDDALLDAELSASYEQGEITLKLTEEEVGFLNECLDTLQEFHSTLQPEEDGWRVPEDIALFESVEKKITELYDDHCVKYQLSPALKAYYEKYGEYGTGEYAMRWEGFRDAFVALNTGGTK